MFTNILFQFYPSIKKKFNNIFTIVSAILKTASAPTAFVPDEKPRSGITPVQTPKSQPIKSRMHSSTAGSSAKKPTNAFTPTSVLKKMHKGKMVCRILFFILCRSQIFLTNIFFVRLTRTVAKKLVCPPQSHQVTSSDNNIIYTRLVF